MAKSYARSWARGLLVEQMAKCGEAQNAVLTDKGPTKARQWDTVRESKGAGNGVGNRIGLIVKMIYAGSCCMRPGVRYRAKQKSG